MESTGNQVSIAPIFRDGRKGHYTLTCPPDKSITHRAVMFAAMAKGSSRVFRPLLGEDCVSTINVFRNLGVKIEIIKGGPKDEGMLKVDSSGWDGWQNPRDELDYGNSGTTARLLMGLFAGTPQLEVTVKGDASLSKRPMARVVKPLRQMGAQIEGEDDGNLLPITIKGGVLSPFDHKIDKASAQIKSALLLAGLSCQGDTCVNLPAGSRDHTEKMLKALGGKISVEQKKNREVVTITGPFNPRALDCRIPGDPSSAAFMMVLAAVAPAEFKLTLKDVLVNPTRTGFMDALEAAGLKFDRSEAAAEQFIEPVQKITIDGGQSLEGFTIEPSQVPTLVDEIPVLAVLAACASGRSTFKGLAELRVKESDRLKKTHELIQLFGVETSVQGDDLIIEGQPDLQIPAFDFDSEGDHRLAMAAAIATARAISPISIRDPDCVEVSFPGFYSHIDAVRSLASEEAEDGE